MYKFCLQTPGNYGINIMRISHYGILIPFLRNAAGENGCRVTPFAALLL